MNKSLSEVALLIRHSTTPAKRYRNSMNEQTAFVRKKQTWRPIGAHDAIRRTNPAFGSVDLL
jgi:hypothetical protein